MKLSEILFDFITRSLCTIDQMSIFDNEMAIIHFTPDIPTRCVRSIEFVGVRSFHFTCMSRRRAFKFLSTLQSINHSHADRCKKFTEFHFIPPNIPNLNFNLISLGISSFGTDNFDKIYNCKKHLCRRVFVTLFFEFLNRRTPPFSFGFW